MWQCRCGTASPASRAVVEHEPITDLLQPQLSRHLGGFQQKMAEHAADLRSGLGDARDGFPGNDQDVRRGPGVDVLEGHHLVVFIDDRGGKLARDDLLEQGLAHFGVLRASIRTSRAQSTGPGSAVRHSRR